VILGDTVAEPEEMFSVALSKPQNARLSTSKSQATGRVAANDLPPAFSIAAELKADDGPGTGTQPSRSTPRRGRQLSPSVSATGRTTR
jgi:hypothetical protein